MPDSISSKIISSSADRIENLSNDIVSNANEIHAIVHPTGNTSGWDSVCMWFQNYSLKNNVQDFFQMDGWNLFITVGVYGLSLYVWYKVIRIYLKIKKDPQTYKNQFLKERLETKKKKNKPAKPEDNSKSIFSIRILLKRLVIWLVKWGWTNIKILPKTIIDFFYTLRFYWNNTILFDRDILSTNGYPLLKLSLKLAILLPLTITFLIAPLSLISQLINGGNYTSALGIYDTRSAEYTNILWATISQYMDPGNLSNSDSIGSVIAIIMAASGIVCLSGLMVSSLVNWISQRRDRWQKGLVLYTGTKAFKNYVVIIGINEQTASLVRQSLRRTGVDYVLIQTRKDVEKARLALELKMDDDLEDKIVFYAGERTSAEDIAKLQVEKATEIFILGEGVNDENEKDHDAFNISCLEHISKYLSDYKDKHKDYKKRKRVHVDFEYQSTFTAFKATHLYQKLDRDIEFVPFNVHEIWAKKVLVDNFAIYPSGNKAELKVQRYNPIDRYKDKNGNWCLGITENCVNDKVNIEKQERTVHLIIFGMNQMGTALGSQAALLCHFPNFAINKDCKTTITFIDDHAKEEADYFMGRYSTLFELSRYRVVDCKKEEIEEAKWIDPFDFTVKGNKDKYGHLLSDISDVKDNIEDSCLLDIQWEFIQGNVASNKVQNYIVNCVTNENKTVTLAICFNNSQQAIASAMYLPKVVFDCSNQVLVYQQNIFDLVNDVSSGDALWNRYKNLFPFGMIESSYTENQYDNILAKLDYCIYRQKGFKEKLIKCIKQEETTKNLLDNLDEIWEQVGIIRKTASIDSVESIPIRLRSMGISRQSDIDAIANEKRTFSTSIIETEHMRWMLQRLIAGYRHVSRDEQEGIPSVEHKQERYRYIEQLKNVDRAHIDICSFKRMQKIDIEMSEKDEEVIKSTPLLLKGRELISVLRLCNNRYKRSQHYYWLKRIFRNKGKNNSFNSFVHIKGSSTSDSKHCSHSFWMCDSTVTVEQWCDVMGIDKSTLEKEHLKMPMVNISKNDVDDFLDILRKRSGLHFEIPSLKEWYVAAENYDFGERNINSSQRVNSIDGDNNAHATKLHHILGNVWEWTHNSNGHNSYDFCGGSYRFGALECNLSKEYFKQSWDENSKSDDLGFRLIWKYDENVPEIMDQFDTTIGSSDKTQIESIKEWFNKDNHRMIPVSSGFFVMGTDSKVDSQADANETPRHAVEITETYFMCQVPVTQSLWNAVMSLSSIRDNPTTNRYGGEIPQTDITWEDICLPSTDIQKGFLYELNTILKGNSNLCEIIAFATYSKPDDYEDDINLEIRESFKKQLMRGELEFRLPTEAEWEYAAKGGSAKHIEASDFEKCKLTYNKSNIKEINKDKYNDEEYHYIDLDSEIYLKKEIKYALFSGNINTSSKDVAWFEEPTIHEVAEKSPNSLEIYDMSGNVWEWCYDYYIFDMYEACKLGDKNQIQANDKYVEGQYNKLGYIKDPVALDDSYSAHVFRGGSWRSTEWDCRCTRANFWIASHKSNDLGFRLVLGKPIKK